LNEYYYAGVVVVSDLSLDLPTAVTRAAGTCVEVRRVSERAIDQPAYTSYAVRGWQTRRPVALGLVRGDWVAWLPPYLTALIATEVIDVVPFPGVDDDKLNEHIVGNVLPFWLATTGRWAFHGSAASHPERGCVGVLGPTHSGKSTTAGVLAADGWELIADDTMTGRLVNGRVMLDSTSNTLHLRGQAMPLADSDAVVRSRLDPEGRETVRAPHLDMPVALDRLLFLSPDAHLSHSAKRVPAPAVVKRLLDNSRVAAWIDEGLRASEFEAAAEIASVVAGFEIATPSRFATLDDYAAYVRRLVGGGAL